MNYQTLLTKYRRDLHKIPELGRQLPKTMAYVQSILEPLDCEIIHVLEYGICAYFHREKQTTTAYRADMDGLPVTEDSPCEYISQHRGSMHACGHDGHMAMTLTFAQYVNGQPNLPCNVLLIFQPAEETQGGAEAICHTGILSKYHVTRIFGIHLWPFIDAGKITSKANAMMPRSSEITIEITGKTSHATSPENGIDALFIGCRYIEEVYTVKQKTDPPSPKPEERTLIQICKMESGTARNIISGYTSLLGTIRAFSEKDFNRLLNILEETGQKLESEYGCTIQVMHTPGYPPVINSPDLYAAVFPALSPLNYEELPQPAMISEDYSFYGLQVPSIFFYLGTGTGIALHSNNFDFDESILHSGFQLYQTLLYA